MRARWLGWAGAEIEAAGETLVLDVLGDPAATFAAFGEQARDVPLPTVVEPDARRSAIAGLVTHLHRDHADAGALSASLAPGAPVLGPPAAGGDRFENLGIAQAGAELSEAGLDVEAMEPWATRDVGPFRLVALPAVDGSGDPQVSWLVEAEGGRVLHLGDTAFHGHWWRLAQRHGPFDLVFVPINGALIDFPHRQPASPLPAVMDPEQAAVAAHSLGAGSAVAIHYDGYEMAPHYRPVRDARRRFEEAAGGQGFEVLPLEPGSSVEVAGG